MSINAMDVEMKLLSGQVMMVGEVPIEPFKLKDVSKIGYTKFQSNINILMLTLDDMIDAVDDFSLSAELKANRHKYKVFDMMVISQDMMELLIESLSMVFRTDDIISTSNRQGEVSLIIKKRFIIDRNNYNEISKVIEVQNNPSLGGVHEDDYNPSGELAKSIADKINKSKEKIRKSKAMKAGNEGITLNDIISAVSVMSKSINKINIWELTIYQLYDDFARLNKIDNYNLQIKASMMSSEVEVEHWSEPL